MLVALLVAVVELELVHRLVLVLLNTVPDNLVATNLELDVEVYV